MNETTSSKDKQARDPETRTAEQGGRTPQNPSPTIQPLADEETDEQPPAEPSDDEPYRMRRPPPEEDESAVHEIPAPLPPLGH
jgi:hypothetical protein